VALSTIFIPDDSVQLFLCFLFFSRFFVCSRQSLIHSLYVLLLLLFFQCSIQCWIPILVSCPHSLSGRQDILQEKNKNHLHIGSIGVEQLTDCSNMAESVSS
jgi:hypothetical protein